MPQRRSQPVELAVPCVTLGRGSPGALARSGAGQSDGPRDPQALPGLGKFPCCSTQEDLILIDETGWSPRQTGVSCRIPWQGMGSQTFNKPGKDLTTAFTVRQEHTCTVTVSE